MRRLLAACALAAALAPGAAWGQGSEPAASATEVVFRVMPNPVIPEFTERSVRILFQEQDAATNALAPFTQLPPNAFVYAEGPLAMPDQTGDWFLVRAKVKPGRYVLTLGMVRYRAKDVIIFHVARPTEKTQAVVLRPGVINYIGDFERPPGKLTRHAAGTAFFVRVGSDKAAVDAAVGASTVEVATEPATFDCGSAIFSPSTSCAQIAQDALKGLGVDKIIVEPVR